MMRPLNSNLTVAVLLGVLGYAAALPAALAASKEVGEFDCVIEPKMTIKLGSPDTGIIERVNVDRDTMVKKGEVLAKLDSDLQKIALTLAKLKAGNDFDIKSALTRLRYRSVDAKRAVSLHEKQYASTKTRDEAVTEEQLAQLALRKAKLDYAMAQVDVAQAHARLDRRSIHSPVNGVVIKVTARPGEYVYEQTPLMTIAEIDPLYVKVFIPVRYYREVHIGTNALVMPEQPIGGVYKAKVTVVDHVFDAASSTFGVRLELANHDYSLPAGLRCRIRFLAENTPP